VAQVRSGPQPRERAALPNDSYKWWVVLMLWSVCFFNYADRQAIYSAFPKLGETFGFNKFQLGMIGSAFMWIYALGAPFAGFVGDRVRRKELILGGCVFWSGITMITGWCSTLWQFITVRALEGLGETFYLPASMSLASDYHSRKTRSRALSFHQSSVYLGTIAGSWAGGWFAEHLDWRDAFYAFGLAGALLAVVLWNFLREPTRGGLEQAGSAPGAVTDATSGPLPVREMLAAIFRAPTAGFLMAAFLCANFVAAIFLVWTPTFLVETFGFKFAAAGLSGSVFIQLASAVGAPMAGVMADGLARRFAGGRIIVQAVGLLVGSFFVFLVGTTSHVTTLLITMACFGFCKGVYDSNIFASLYDMVEPRARATAAGIMNAVGWGGGGLGPLLLGWFAGRGGQNTETGNMSKALACCSGVYLLGAGLLLVALFVFARRDIESRTNRETANEECGR
jgi:MFS family permease